jgi:Protein of unknown function (DUF3617)
VKGMIFAIVMVGPVLAWSQDLKPVDVKPGLWENTTTTEMSGMSMPNMPALSADQLAKIPPDQRARIEAMMKGGAGSPRTTTTKGCVTSEMLSKPLFDNGDKSCTFKLVNSSAGSQQIHAECSRGNGKTTGDLNLERVDSEHYKGTMVMKMSADGASRAGSQNMNIKFDFTSKWLSSDCGDVKPAGSGK